MTGPAVQFSNGTALRLSLPCHLPEVRPATLLVSGFLNQQGLPPEEVRACELALVEACNNAVQYARGGGRLEKVEIDVLCDAGGVELRILDHTPGFDWPRVVELPAPEQERGRGLFLIQSLMSEAEYFRGCDSNCLVLRRRISGRAGSPGAWEKVNHRLRESEQIIGDMAEELSFCYESLSAIFRCSTELGRENSLEEFSQRLLSDLAQITSADWFVLRLVSRDGNALQVFAASEEGLELPPLALSGKAQAASLEVQSALGRQDVWFESESTQEAREPLRAAGPGCSGLIHAFALGERLMGTLAIGKAPGQAPFTAVHANVVHTFADFLGIQMANARFQEEQVRARLVARELEIAKSIQESLLPRTLPQPQGFGLAGFCSSARQVGGDFYDVLEYSDHSLLLIVADVMGKGMPAAIFAALLRSLLRAAPEWTSQPSHLLSRVNRLLFQELSGVDMFITAQVVFVDTAERRLVAASAGHCPMLLASDAKAEVKVLSPEGLPLGIKPDAAFGAQSEELTGRSRILLYTDGLTDVRDPDGQFFGQERLIQWFGDPARRFQSALEQKETLARELEGFRGSAAIEDDQTFLIMA